MIKDKEIGVIAEWVIESGHPVESAAAVIGAMARIILKFGSVAHVEAAAKTLLKHKPIVDEAPTRH